METQPQLEEAGEEEQEEQEESSRTFGEWPTYDEQPTWTNDDWPDLDNNNNNNSEDSNPNEEVTVTPGTELVITVEPPITRVAVGDTISFNLFVRNESEAHYPGGRLRLHNPGDYFASGSFCDLQAMKPYGKQRVVLKLTSISRSAGDIPSTLVLHSTSRDSKILYQIIEIPMSMCNKTHLFYLQFADSVCIKSIFQAI